MTSLVRSVLISITFIGLAACKQGEGERCQIESDCEDGLTCTTQNLCEGMNDVPRFDGGLPDARPDANAPVDGATFDAPPAIDAAPIDAGTPDAAIDAAP